MVQKTKVSMSHSLKSTSTHLSDKNFFEKTKTKFFTFLSRHLDKDIRFLSQIFFLLEMVFFFNCLAFLVSSSLAFITRTNPMYKFIVDILFAFIKPMDAINDLITFSVVFGVFTAFLFLIFFFSIYLVMMQQTPNDILHYVCFIAMRVTRTVFFFPLMQVLLRPLMCDYFSGFGWLQFEGISCLDFPYFFFWIFGFFGFAIFILICVIDVLFLLDKLRSVKFLTASCDGRFQICLCLFLAVIFLIKEVAGVGNNDKMESDLEEGEVWKPNPLGYIMLFVTSFVFFIFFAVYVRVLPFYNQFYTYIYGSFLMLIVVFCFGAGCTVISQDYWGLSFFAISIIAVPIAIMIIFFRILVIKIFYKKRIKYNWMLSRSAHDIVLILYLTNRKKTCIQTVLSNPKFQKDKRLCVLLMSILIDQDIALTNQILKHLNAMKGRILPDTRFFLHYLKSKITEKQYCGIGTKAREVKLLKNIRVTEDKLRKLFKKLFGALLEEHISFNNFPSLVSSIQLLLTLCDNFYSRLLKLFPSERTYRKYGKYLQEFKNDKYSSELFFNEANILEGSASNASNDSLQSSEMLSESSVEANNNNNNNNKELQNLSSSAKDDNRTTVIDINSEKSGGSNVKKREESINSFGSHLSSAKSRKTHQEERIIVQKKVHNTKDIIYYCVLIGLLMFFIITIGSIAGVMITVIVYNNQMINSVNLIEESVGIRLNTVNVAHYARKLQISYYDNSIVPYESERNSSYYKETIGFYADKLIESASAVKNLGMGLNTMVSLETNNAGNVQLPLYDSLTLYAAKSNEIYLIKDSEFSKYPNESSVQINNAAFKFVLNNQKSIYNAVDSFIKKNEDYNVSIASWRIESNIFLCFLISLILLLIYFFVVFIFATLKQRASFKGFLLLPKRSIIEKYELFGGNVEDESLVVEKNTPLIQRFLYIMNIGVFWYIVIFLYFYIIMLLLSPQYQNRNSLYISGKKTEVTSRLIHRLIPDLLYRSDSIYKENEVIDELNGYIGELIQTTHGLRFGNVEEGIYYGVDSYAFSMNGLYLDKCNEKEVNSLYEKIDCMSLNRKFLVYATNALEIIKEVKNKTSCKQDLRNSPMYKSILLLDEGLFNDSNIIYNTANERNGLLTIPLNNLLTLIETVADGYYRLVFNSSLILVSFGVLGFLFLFFGVLYSYPKKNQ